MKKLIIATLAIATLAFTAPAVQAGDLLSFDPITLTNVPATTSATTNGNTNFSSQMINPNGKDISVWIKAHGTNATSSGTAGFASQIALDKTNFIWFDTNTITYNGTNPVIKRFSYPASNFWGVANLKYGAVTNISTNQGVIDWIKITREH